MAALGCWVWVSSWPGGLEAPGYSEAPQLSVGSPSTWMSLSSFLLHQNSRVWVSVARDNPLGWSTVCWNVSSAGGKEDGEILMVNNLWFRLL